MVGHMIYVWPVQFFTENSPFLLCPCNMSKWYKEEAMGSILGWPVIVAWGTPVLSMVSGCVKQWQWYTAQELYRLMRYSSFWLNLTCLVPSPLPSLPLIMWTLLKTIRVSVYYSPAKTMTQWISSDLKIISIWYHVDTLNCLNKMTNSFTISTLIN